MKKTNLIFLFVTICFVVFTILILVISFNNESSNDYPWYYEKLNLKNTKDKCKEKNKIKVAFLDTGLDYNIIPYMKTEIIDGYNCIKKSDDFDDENGHGTSVITLAAFESDTIEYFGISNNIIIVPIVVADSTGKTNEDYLYDGIMYAISRNVSLINISIGSRYISEKIEEALYKAYCNDIIVVCSAGDYSDSNISYPASSEYTIAIASQSILGVPFLNANYNDKCLLMPGENISILKWNSYDLEFNVGIGNGSSYACAIFTAVLSMYLSNDKDIKELRTNILEEICVQKNEYNFLDVYTFI